MMKNIIKFWGIVKFSIFNFLAELFGIWQTDVIVQKVAKDGIVPKNERGQVDMFHELLIPKGVVKFYIKIYLEIFGFAIFK